MEHSLDSNEFLYDNRRICSKLYVFLKFIGIIFYASILPTCNNHDFYIGMIVAMFLSIINSVRYEYAHFIRYGTIFLSINEFEEWKKELYPKLRILFSMVELVIKIVYFIRIFPPVCVFHNLCEIGESIFKIHVIAILIIYIIAGFFSTCLLCSFHTIDNSHHQQTFSSSTQIFVINDQNEECCICIDNDNTNPWSMLPCGHKFHKECISPWIQINHTCPICRFRI